MEQLKLLEVGDDLEYLMTKYSIERGNVGRIADERGKSSKQDTAVKPEEKNGEQVLKDDITKQFAGLPMNSLIRQPIIEVTKGQMAFTMDEVTVDFDMEVTESNGDKS